MPDTFSAMAAANGTGPAHDTGYSLTPPEPPRSEAPPPPTPAELREEIRDLLASNPPLLPDDAGLLVLMGQHDAPLGAALAKLPERDGIGGAAVAILARKYRGTVDLLKAVKSVAATLVFWPEPVPADEALQEAALRLAEFNLDAAKELARAHTFLGPRFTLRNSVRVLLEKYTIPHERFSAANGTPVEGLTATGVEMMLAQGQLDVLNDLLRPFEIAIRQKIGTVNPVFSLVEKDNGRHVMPTRELIEFLRKRAVFA